MLSVVEFEYDVEYVECYGVLICCRMLSVVEFEYDVEYVECYGVLI